MALRLSIEEVENGYLLRDTSKYTQGERCPIWIAKNHADLAGIVIQLAVEADDDGDTATTSGG